MGVDRLNVPGMELFGCITTLKSPSFSLLLTYIQKRSGSLKRNEFNEIILEAKCNSKSNRGREIEKESSNVFAIVVPMECSLCWIITSKIHFHCYHCTFWGSDVNTLNIIAVLIAKLSSYKRKNADLQRT